MLECLEIRIGFWVVATIMAANDGFSQDSFSWQIWLQNILIVNFVVPESLQFLTRISSDQKVHAAELFYSENERRWKMHSVCLVSIDHQCIGYLRIELMIFRIIRCCSISIGFSTDFWIFYSYRMVLEYRDWWIC